MTAHASQAVAFCLPAVLHMSPPPNQQVGMTKAPAGRLRLSSTIRVPSYPLLIGKRPRSYITQHRRGLF